MRYVIFDDCYRRFSDRYRMFFENEDPSFEFTSCKYEFIKTSREIYDNLIVFGISTRYMHNDVCIRWDLE